MLIKLINLIILVILVLLNVAFITLIERKILGLSQLRLGPNKVRFWGLLQPISDAIKLFTKKIAFSVTINRVVFFLRPLLIINLILLIWFTYPSSLNSTILNFSTLTIMLILSLGVYPLFFRGWFSNNKYATIGALRGISQTISYEIRLAILIFSIIIISLRFQLKSVNLTNHITPILFLNPILVVLWLVSGIAETNRTPFDFSEGESELVSGFNIEYAGVVFALIFIAEYGIIYFFSLISTIILLIRHLNIFKFVIFTASLIYFWIWLRASYPRFRYDLLITLAWKRILPFRLVLCLYFIALNNRF